MEKEEKKYLPFRDGDEAFYRRLIEDGGPVPPIDHKTEPKPFTTDELEDMINYTDDIKTVRRLIAIRRESIRFWHQMQDAITDHNYTEAKKGEELIKKMLDGAKGSGTSALAARRPGVTGLGMKFEYPDGTVRDKWGNIIKDEKE